MMAGAEAEGKVPSYEDVSFQRATGGLTGVQGTNMLCRDWLEMHEMKSKLAAQATC